MAQIRSEDTAVRGRRRRALIVAVVTSGSLVLTGCGSADEPAAPQALDCAIPQGPVAFAVGGRSNTPAVSGTPVLGAVVNAAAAKESSVVLLDTGGRPSAQPPISLELESKNGAAREREAAEKARMLAQQMARVAATSPEANPLEALNLAADSVRSAQGDAQGGTIVLVDSGLQTMGALDYRQDGMMSAEPQDVVKALQATGQLPDLTGMTVYLVGIGQTVEPQQALDAGARHNVQAQWRALTEAAGAACVDFDDTPRNAPAPAGLPAVRPVPVAPVTPEIPLPGKPLHLRIPFNPDSDEYVDPQGAADELRPTAEAMKRDGFAVTLTGTTATHGTEEGRKRLSQMRADRVKQTLVELGADPAKITTKGVGTDHPSHVQDIGPDGQLIPAQAAQNRLVIVERVG